MRSAGGEMWVGTQRVTGLTHVRSGDVIRMSASGPEFSFAIVAVAKASPAKMPDNTTAAPPTSGKGAAASVAPIGPEAPHESSPAAAAPSSADLSAVRPATTGMGVVKASDHQWVKWVAGLAVGILALVVVKVVLPPSPPVVVNVQTGGGPTTATPSSTAAQPASNPTKTRVSAEIKGNGNKSPESTGGPPPSPTPAAALVAKIDPTVFLITTEKANHYWPHATCVAVGKDTLLTTAFDAMDLVKMRDKESYKIWVTRPANDSSSDSVEFRLKFDVQDIRVLEPYARLPEEPDSTERLFVNIGLLTVRGTLPKYATLASPSESGAIKAGLRVHCFGFAQDHTMMTSDDVFEPQMTNASVRFIESARQKLPGDPKLLLVHGEIPENSYGNPVVNDEGKVLGLYSDAVPKEKHLKDYHYITMVTPEQVDLWLRDRNNAKIWVPATAGPAASTTEEQP